MNTFDNIVSRPLGGRTIKPRVNGLTMIMDNGIGIAQLKDFLQISSEWIDIAKLGYGTSRLCPEEVVRAKIEAYRAHNIYVMPGGTFTEIVLAQGKLNEFLAEAKELGFNALEVSDGTIRMNDDTRGDVIRQVAGEGFMVLSEVGSKFPDSAVSLKELIQEIHRDIELGVFQVIIEARESGVGIGIFNFSGNIVDEILNSIAEESDLTKVMFEAPQKNQQVALIQQFGVNVNMGNIQPGQVLSLETLRAGLRADTLRGIYD
ncbi:phosphosulfolactate synthase [Gemmatimonadota bacterium]